MFNAAHNEDYTMTITLTIVGSPPPDDENVVLFVVTMEDEKHENRMTTQFLEEWSLCLSKMYDYYRDHHTTQAIAMITIGAGRFFSNGVDLDNIQHPAAFLDDLQALLSRLLTVPWPTIAAINGHAFGGGCMLALAHDFRVMRTDRGWLCVPAVRLGLSLPVNLVQMAKSRLTPTTARDLLLLGMRFSPTDALESGLVDSLCEEEVLLGHAQRMATDIIKSMNGRGEAWAAMRQAQLPTTITTTSTTKLSSRL